MKQTIKFVQNFETDVFIKKIVASKLPIGQMLNQSDDLNYIQMTEVPKGYFKTIKNRKGKHLTFYDNLLQITMRSHGIIIDLDELKEVEAIENIDQLQQPDTMVNTGFIMSASTSCEWEGEHFLRRI